jgi:transposase InsO family protein
VQALGIQHRYIKPRRPQQNGKVERSHRIDQEEFWGRHRFADFDAAAVGLRAWETRYNHEHRAIVSPTVTGRMASRSVKGMSIEEVVIAPHSPW